MKDNDKNVLIQYCNLKKEKRKKKKKKKEKKKKKKKKTICRLLNKKPQIFLLSQYINMQGLSWQPTNFFFSRQ
jgi:hypothetical protein